MSKLFKGIPEVVVCYDNDEAGQNGGRELCCSIGPKAKRILWELDKVKGYDLNDLFLECGSRDEFLKKIERYSKTAKAEVKPFLKPSVSLLDSLEERMILEAKNEIIGISSGYPRFDCQFSGLHGITVVGGKPKGGKTTFVGNIAIKTAEQGYITLYMDYENGKFNLLKKIIANVFHYPVTEVGKNHKEIFNPSKRKPEHDRLSQILDNLYFVQPSMRDINDKYALSQEISTQILEKYILYLQDELAYTKPILFIVDSLQKLPACNTNDKRFSIDGWLRSFEWIRNQYDITFLIVSEIARGKYNNPGLGAFKESGDIEYTADLALLLENQGSVIELSTVANRNGEIGDPILYTADFKHWKLNEIDNRSFRKKIKK